MSKINLYNNDIYRGIIQSSKTFESSESGKYYKSFLCMKSTTDRVREHTIEQAYQQIQENITNSLQEILEHNYSKLCVLPKCHTGRCTANPLREMLLKNKTNDKIINKVQLSIMTTPGADDYIFKNRASRLFPIIFTNDQERKLKSKQKKLKVAIPIKEFSTPFCLATAYFDWMVYILNVKKMREQLKKTSKYLSIYGDLLLSHKQYLQKFFQNRNRIAFNIQGFTICSITRNQIAIKDIADIERDNRVNVNENDVQMGHLIPRTEKQITIRGLNLSVMTRNGNRIIGDYVLFQDDWISILHNIIKPYL